MSVDSRPKGIFAWPTDSVVWLFIHISVNVDHQPSFEKYTYTLLSELPHFKLAGLLVRYCIAFQSKVVRL